MKPGIHVTPKVDYGKFDWDRPQGHRRSVYRFVFRTLPDPLVECLDGADASTLTPKRTESVTAPQALALLNNEFVLVHAKAMAARLEKHSAGAREADRVRAAGSSWGRAADRRRGEAVRGLRRQARPARTSAACCSTPTSSSSRTERRGRR